MANTAVGFGVALILVGVVGYVATGAESPTALIPAAIGILLAAAGALGRNPARRKMAMHLAALIGLLGFFGAARGLTSIGAVLSGEPVERPAAVIAQSIMAVLCLIFVVMCVRSFINARRSGAVETR
ncbi:MAG TPA: hypothetical protein VES20_10745 [Bryobacteraceae bacterium]|nr:hypothetical protein [Bryobacteraceae bacterium]